MPSTPRGERTEAAFLEAAKKVFADKGYFNAKISDICEAAGKSTGSFYNYYDNKESLLEHLAEEFIDNVLGQPDPDHHEDPYKNIEELIARYWKTYKANLPTMIGLFQMSMTDEGFAVRWRRLRKRGLDNMAIGIRKARRDGFGQGLDEQALASAIMSMVDSFCWTWLATGGEPGFLPIDEDVAISTLADVWYRTLYFRP